MAKTQENIGLTASYPDVDVSYETKLTNKYGLKWARAITDDWWGKESQFYRERYDIIEENRAYAIGMETTEGLKQQENQTGDVSLLALDYRNMSVMPRIIKVMVDHIMQLPEVRLVKATDPLSLTEREEYKRELIGKLYNRELILEAREAFGQEFDEDDFLPEDREEIKMHMELTYKQSIEIAIKQVIDLIFNINNYDAQIKRGLIYDTIVDGLAATKNIADSDRGLTIKKVDVKHFVHSSSSFPDYSDMFYAGEVEQISIYELKRQTKGEFPEEKWKKVANTYSGKHNYGHVSESRTDYSSFIGERIYDYDEAFVDVLHFRVILPCKSKFKEKKTAFGNDSFTPKKDTYNKQPYSKAKVIEDEYETVFEGHYVLNSSDVIYGWKPASNVAMDANNFRKAQLGYNVYMPENYKGKNRSYVDFMKAPVDQMKLANLKIQQMVSQAKPTGYKIDVSAMENIDLGGGGNLGYLDVIDIYDNTGRLYYRSRSSEGEWQNPDPIAPLANQIQNINELMGVYNFYFEQVLNVTGVTPNMLGDIGNRQGAATVESSINSSASAISDVANAYSMITIATANNVVSMFSDIPKDDKLYKYYSDAIGGADMKVVDSLDDRSLRSFGITISIDTDKEARLALEQSIQISLTNQELRLEDAMQVRQVADVDVKLAQQYLILRRKKYQKEKRQELEHAQMAQSQSNMQATQMAAQVKQQEMMLEVQVYQQKEAIRLQSLQAELFMKAGIDSKLSQQDFMEDMQLKGLETQNKAQQTANANAMAFAKNEQNSRIQKENIILRNSLGSKQNPSIANDET